MSDPIYSPSVNLSGEEAVHPKEENNGLVSHLIDFVQSFVLFGAIFAIIFLFVAQPHKVSGSSMFPTFIDGDYILTDKLTYRFGEPKRGDVIILKNPRNEKQDFIKRIMGLPGDTIKVQGGKVYVNDQQVPEEYLSNEIYTRGGNFLSEGVNQKVDEDHYFVMGDNRNHSSDSRDWGFITHEEIIGKVFFRYWPINEFGTT